MQDISRDDFGLLSGSSSGGVGVGCDKDVHLSRTTSPIPSTPPPIPDSGYHNCTDIAPVPVSSPFSPNLDRVNIKIEESCSDLYESTPPPTWHHPHHHSHHPVDIGSSKLLLKNSDDPLISCGANIVEGDDDNPNELNSIVAAAAGVANQQNMSPGEIHSPLLPTRSPQSKRNKNPAGSSSRPRRKGTFKLRFHHQALPAEYLSHYEASLNQQQNKTNNNNNNTTNNNSKKYNEQQNNAKMQSNNSHETVRSWLQQISETQSANNLNDSRVEGQSDVTTPAMPQQSPKRMVSYSDLPYMGEMTLENTKPRRGRKPKKADICHLIFKNYGTIFPGTPKDIVEEETKGLLEKRLKEQNQQTANLKQSSEQPLNLCLRDQSTDSFTISSEDENSEDLNQSNRTTPITTPSDAVTDALLAANLKMSLPNFQSALLDRAPEDIQTPSTGDSEKTSSSGYGYWPNAGNVFIHPMALYYQKMMDAGFHPPAPPQASPSAVKKTEGGSPKIFPKHLSQLIKKEKTEPPEPCSTPSSIKSTSSSTTATTASGHNHGLVPPQKRKRSAIFIPPIPAENTTNPATEVSICKFKFTGGAKPSLQEKKMLSVDSDGNYRYYSGTGDKSMRGYEFFPRESLQQSGLIPGVNSAAAFLNATGEKISHDLPPPSMGLSNELLQLPDSPPGGMILPTPQSSLLGQSMKMRHSSSHGSGAGSSSSQHVKEKRKRKSRRSLQREKLEQTFKEKGFLIQTQQLESAEGATYCKFRQLRKFTRYLFRSWKDHLPGELQHANAANTAMNAAPTGKQTSVLQKSLATASTSGQSGDKLRRT
ncbi:probable serine/threonine-protein kinase nek3 isoform X2 [Hermetia illucens]|nr:probable serine/threonine-protein kinase nek3 isoform X2 [Hermetia illucens]